MLALTAQRTPSAPLSDQLTGKDSLTRFNDSLLLNDAADLAVNGGNATVEADKSYREYGDGEIRWVLESIHEELSLMK